MKIIFSFCLLFSLSISSFAQTFTRSALPTPLTTPWEIVYGPDNFLWISEDGGTVSRVHPLTGAKTIVYVADDYFPGSPLEQSTLCFQPNIGSGTMGLALHPDFMEEGSSFIYYVYSYNNGSESAPETRYKLERLTWNPNSETVTDHADLVLALPNGYDHLGGRLMSIKREGIPYLFLSMGDNGISEDNSPGCYVPESANPNNHAQDPQFKNGKIHRFNMDGSIPTDNPIAGNSFYTRGHRNPQGLIYNPHQDVLYDVEHGDRIDDEINILQAGMNYGWKDVRGYSSDNNYPGEAEYVAAYVPDPNIAGDMLVDPLYSWCATTPSTSDDFLEWCTVAPSGGIYYQSNGIPGWDNSLLVVTLKNGTTTNNEMYRFKLNQDGISLAPSTVENPNPQRYFAEDQALNGRLRDIALSPDGTKIYLINNNDDIEEQITIYTLDPNSTQDMAAMSNFKFYPNPANDVLTLPAGIRIAMLSIYDAAGSLVLQERNTHPQLDISLLSVGIYTARIITLTGETMTGRFMKE